VRHPRILSKRSVAVIGFGKVVSSDLKAPWTSCLRGSSFASEIALSPDVLIDKPSLWPFSFGLEKDGRLIRHLAGEPAVIIPPVKNDGHPRMDRRDISSLASVVTMLNDWSQCPCGSSRFRTVGRQPSVTRPISQ